MNEDIVQTLIDGGETLAVEFKSEAKSPLSDREIIEAVVCLTNRSDGHPAWLLIGVEDDGRITGARPRHGGHTDPHRLAALIASRTRPGLNVRTRCNRQSLWKGCPRHSDTPTARNGGHT